MDAIRHNSWAGRSAQCPFYKGDTERSVACEGWLEDKNVLTEVRFNGPQKKKKYTKIYCCSTGYKSCGIYKMLMAKYGVKTL